MLFVGVVGRPMSKYILVNYGDGAANTSSVICRMGDTTNDPTARTLHK